ncbi:lipoprotein [Spiroplasma endosymbiont of Aspidapion aeneum]|uniref:lipoprotein n=1 Tax=Spiroplasma endosymbiont of Aspidapion aeneum TaxID=3066276 RepID=UPI00313BE7B6
MKRILALLGGIGLLISSSTTVISCENDNNNKPNKPDENVEKPWFKMPAQYPNNKDDLKNIGIEISKSAQPFYERSFKAYHTKPWSQEWEDEFRSTNEDYLKFQVFNQLYNALGYFYYIMSNNNKNVDEIDTVEGNELSFISTNDKDYYDSEYKYFINLSKKYEKYYVQINDWVNNYPK